MNGKKYCYRHHHDHHPKRETDLLESTLPGIFVTYLYGSGMACWAPGQVIFHPAGLEFPARVPRDHQGHSLGFLGVNQSYVTNHHERLEPLFRAELATVASGSGQHTGWQ